MVLWRISRFHDLNGEGEERFSARWNIAGTPMVYLSDSAASSLLEMCVHTAAHLLPPNFSLLRVNGPEVTAEEISLAELPPGWVANLPLTQRLGDAWLQSGQSSLLRVPSVLVPETWNYLLNPLHPNAAAFHIEHIYEYPFDLRLKN